MIHENFRCEIYFIRHGQSVSNSIPGYVVGQDANSPLTEKGWLQARLLGRRFARERPEFDRIYSSTMTRAIQTTEAMLESMGQPDRPFSRVAALVEQRSDGWQGVREEDAYTPELRAYMSAKGFDFVPPGGESLRIVQRRVSQWLEDELIYNEDLTSAPTSLKVAIVGHGAATKTLFHYIMGFSDRLIWRVGMDNCSISRFVFTSRGWFPVCLNDAAHIREAEEV